MNPEILKAIGRFLWLKKNDTTVQKSGTATVIMTILAMVIWALSEILPIVMPLFENPDAVIGGQTIEEVQEPGDIVDDVLEAAIIVGKVPLAVASTLLGMSCSGNQVEQDQVINASVVCGAALMASAMQCINECHNLVGDDIKECAAQCVHDEALDDEGPRAACIEAYGSLHSEALATAINQAVKTILAIVDIAVDQ